MHDCIYIHVYITAVFAAYRLSTVGFDPGSYVITRPCNLLDGLSPMARSHSRHDHDQTSEHLHQIKLQTTYCSHQPVNNTKVYTIKMS